jgi:hypothetical protein
MGAVNGAAHVVPKGRIGRLRANGLSFCNKRNFAFDERPNSSLFATEERPQRRKSPLCSDNSGIRVRRRRGMRGAFFYWVKAVLVFGIPKSKDALGSQAYSAAGVAQRAIARVKRRFRKYWSSRRLPVRYSSHGHCAYFPGASGCSNDPTRRPAWRERRSATPARSGHGRAFGHADGRVAALRAALDTTRISRNR